MSWLLQEKEKDEKDEGEEEEEDEKDEGEEEEKEGEKEEKDEEEKEESKVEINIKLYDVTIWCTKKFVHFANSKFHVAFDTLTWWTNQLTYSDTLMFQVSIK